jgi:hypothetical protein
MKVVFEDEKSKSVLISNVRKLGTADEKFKSISIVHDMTKRERELKQRKGDTGQRKKCRK